MNEKARRKQALWISGATATIALTSLNLFDNTPAQADLTTTTELSTSSTFSDPDVLRICRAAGVIDQVCALDQAILEIESGDSVMAGVWAYHVTEPGLRTQLDYTELIEAQEAAVKHRFGECVVWASRVIDPLLREQLPVCE